MRCLGGGGERGNAKRVFSFFPNSVGGTALSARPSRKTLTRKLDAAWSLAVRSRGSCERCGRSEGVLHAHHMVGRQRHIIRWSMRNGVCLCYRCHRWAEGDAMGFTDWIRSLRPADAEWCNRLKDMPANFSDKDLERKLAKLTADQWPESRVEAAA